MELGKTQKLKIKRFTSVGAYLNDEKSEEGDLLLPKKQIPEKSKIDDEIEVFVYRDSLDRPIATTKKPYIEVGRLAHLKVQSTTKIGAFLDIGLERDLLLPFSETNGAVEKGKTYLVKMYIDKSGRLAASMKIKDLLLKDSSYKENDRVTGTVYSIHKEHGVFVAVDDKYDALIPKNEALGILETGEIVEARVSNVSKDGRLFLSLKDRAHLNIDEDAEHILDLLEDEGGILNLGDKSSPEKIKEITGMSKASFKRAIGKLYKEREIKLYPEKIELI